jgi:N-methylhydantoinase A/oxoprolinase/acetone carboxylase beta subunit
LLYFFDLKGGPLWPLTHWMKETDVIIGLDVGGTHTDVVLLRDDGIAKNIKVPTEPTRLFETVQEGLERVLEGIEPQAIHRVVLSTTLTTNAIVQNKMAPVGMIVSSGPGLDPELFRTHPHYYAVSGSIDHRGREIAPVNEQEIKDIAAKLKAEGIRYAGVVTKFSVRNPQQELQIQQILEKSLDKVFTGHRISGNLNFPRRIATTHLNASVYPVHREFFEAVTNSLAQKGLQVPIHILKADGGTMNFRASMDFPGQTILSGPAASIMGAIAFAPEEESSIVLDIGGTTTDIAVLVNQTPLLHPLGIQLGGYQTLIRALHTHSIGIGGDSAISVENGDWVIGPERRGPALAYGGPCPTPTDALHILKIMNEGDLEKARQGFQPLADALNMSVTEAARQVLNQTCRLILQAVAEMIEQVNSQPVYTVHEVYEGQKISPRVALVIGGPAPAFAEQLEALSDFKVGVVPRWKVANAIGAALARTTCEVTLYADTHQEIAMAPEENFREEVPENFAMEDAIATAKDLLHQKAVQRGAGADDLEMEIVEKLQFNMVRGFYAAGRNIRVRAQIKPGLINEYDTIAGLLATV